MSSLYMKLYPQNQAT